MFYQNCIMEGWMEMGGLTPRIWIGVFFFFSDGINHVLKKKTTHRTPSKSSFFFFN